MVMQHYSVIVLGWEFDDRSEEENNSGESDNDGGNEVLKLLI